MDQDLGVTFSEAESGVNFVLSVFEMIPCGHAIHLDSKSDKSNCNKTGTHRPTQGNGNHKA